MTLKDGENHGFSLHEPFELIHKYGWSFVGVDHRHNHCRVTNPEEFKPGCTARLTGIELSPDGASYDILVQICD